MFDCSVTILNFCTLCGVRGRGKVHVYCIYNIYTNCELLSVKPAGSRHRSSHVTRHTSHFTLDTSHFTPTLISAAALAAAPSPPAASSASQSCPPHPTQRALLPHLQSPGRRDGRNGSLGFRVWGLGFKVWGLVFGI